MSGPNIWGPHGWKFIHYITIGYPLYPSNDDKKNYLDFFNQLKHVIPCSICGNNYAIHIKKYPLTFEILDNKKRFIEWGITMHNLVNLSNNKKQYSFNEGLQEILDDNIDDCPGYTDMSINKPSKSINTLVKNNSVNIYLIIIIIILLCFISLKYIKTKI